MNRERKLSREAGEQAAEAWEALQRPGETSTSEQREHSEWMLRSPENVESYLRVSRTMQTLRSPSIRWPDTSAETLIREAREYTSRAVTPLRDEPPPT